MALSSTAVVKVIIVTDDLERTAAAYEKLLGSSRTMDGDGKEHRMVREPYTRYKGQPISDTPMKVRSVLSENFWFEIIQPLGDNDPWAQWLKDH